LATGRRRWSLGGKGGLGLKKRTGTLGRREPGWKWVSRKPGFPPDGGEC